MESKLERNLAGVIDAIANEMPSEVLATVRSRLKSIRSSYIFRAPELKSNDWKDVQQVLLRLAPGYVMTDWVKKVTAIFADKMDYRIYLPQHGEDPLEDEL